MKRPSIEDLYYDWLIDLVCDDNFHRDNYSKLLGTLHGREFTWIIERDENRASYGINLRYRFAAEEGLNPDICDYELAGPCSVLELMVALALRCEEILCRTDSPNGTPKWFWGMISNMELDDSYDRHFSNDYVNERIDILLERKYESDGSGGLFRVNNAKEDLRKVEIWFQCCWFIDELLGYS